MITAFEGQLPAVAADAFIAQSADVIGRVRLGAGSSIWFGAVLRGDVAAISIGERSNIQDTSVVHVTEGKYEAIVGSAVTVGHSAIVHGCTIADHVLIGMGACIMDGASVGSYSIIGARALVTPGTQIPEGVLAVGAPARVVRKLTDEERRSIDESAAHYAMLAARYRVSA